MTLAFRKCIPGRADINLAFSRRNLQRMKALYDKLERGDGYQFGELITAFYDLNKTELAAWHHEIKDFYPPEIQNEIVRTIVAALTHKDDNAEYQPIPVRFDWLSGEKCGGATPGVRVTYDSVSPHYHIEIIGYPSPPGSALERRRKPDAPLADDDIEG